MLPLFPEYLASDLPVIQNLLMMFMIGLLPPLFSQFMCPFYSLLLPRAAIQLVLVRDRDHQIDKHIIDDDYHSAYDRVNLRRCFIRLQLPRGGHIQADNSYFMLFNLLFRRNPVAVAEAGQAVYLTDQQDVIMVTVRQ